MSLIGQGCKCSNALSWLILISRKLDQSAGSVLTKQKAHKKKPHYRSSEAYNMLALPIFPGSRPPSIVGADVLNFCVRYGNRWTHMTINTNSFGWLFTIFYIKALPSCDLLVTRTGFEPMLKAWEASVLTTWPTGHWCTFTDSNRGPTD